MSSFIEFNISRFNPECDATPYTQTYRLETRFIRPDTMLLEALEQLREQDPTLTFRSSCKEGVCGSDGMNVNGKNHLSCITPLTELIHQKKGRPLEIRPLPGLPIIKDLVVDMTQFYDHYKQVQPFLQPAPKDLDHEILQTPEQRARLDGHYECVLCACCTTSCPSFWWNPDQFLGPAALLSAQRFVIDSRDIHTRARLEELDDVAHTFRCRNIQNCTDSCPKGLNPSQAIQDLKHEMFKKQVNALE